MATAVGVAPPASMDNIVCAIRVRPLNERERKLHKSPSWRVDAETASIAQVDAAGNARDTFSYDYVFDEVDGTDRVYNQAAAQVVKSVMDGMNGKACECGLVRVRMCGCHHTFMVASWIASRARCQPLVWCVLGLFMCYLHTHTHTHITFRLCP